MEFGKLTTEPALEEVYMSPIVYGTHDSHHVSSRQLVISQQSRDGVMDIRLQTRVSDSTIHSLTNHAGIAVYSSVSNVGLTIHYLDILC